MCANADTVLAGKAEVAMLTDAGPAAHFAFGAPAAVRTDAAPATVLAVVALAAMCADASPTAILAHGVPAAVLTDSAPAALLATAALAAMHANAAPAALLAGVAKAVMLASAAPAALLATVPLASMLTDGGPTALLAGVPHASMVADADASTPLAAVASATVWAALVCLRHCWGSRAAGGDSGAVHRVGGGGWLTPAALHTCHRATASGNLGVAGGGTMHVSRLRSLGRVRGSAAPTHGRQCRSPSHARW